MKNINLLPTKPFLIRNRFAILLIIGLAAAILLAGQWLLYKKLLEDVSATKLELSSIHDQVSVLRESAPAENHNRATSMQ